MPKQLVETTGQFELVDFDQGGLIIRANRPTVAEQTSFLSGRAALGQVKILGDLSDEATDAEFEKYWKESDGDMNLAIASFKSSFADEVSKDETPPPTSRKNRKPEPAPAPEVIEPPASE